MPDFNFAKGNSKRDTGDSSRPRQPRAGSGGSAMQQHPGQQTGDAPSRTVSTSEPAGTAAGAAQPRSSVLDKYPERDLSHLSGDTPPPPSEADIPPDTAAAPVPPADSTSEAEPSAATDETAETHAASGTAGAKSSSSSNWPLVAILSVVGILLIIAFIWHVNPWPPLKNAIAGLFTSDQAVETVLPETNAVVDDDLTQETAAAMRSWDYFIQVSSWPDLAKAARANDHGLDAPLAALAQGSGDMRRGDQHHGQIDWIRDLKHIGVDGPPE